MKVQEAKQLKDIQLKRDKFRQMAKTTEFIFIALWASALLILNPPNLVMVIILAVGYLTINGVLWINAVPLIRKAKELFDRIF